MALKNNSTPAANAATAGETIGKPAFAGKSPLPARKKKVRMAPVKRASKANHALMEKEKAEKLKIIDVFRKKAGDWSGPRYSQSIGPVGRGGKFSILIKKKTKKKSF